MSIDFDKYRTETAEDFNQTLRAVWKLKKENTEAGTSFEFERLERNLERLRNRVVFLVCLESDGGDKFGSVDVDLVAVREEDNEE